MAAMLLQPRFVAVPSTGLNNLQSAGCCFSLPNWLIGVNEFGSSGEPHCCYHADNNEPKLTKVLNIELK